MLLERRHATGTGADLLNRPMAARGLHLRWLLVSVGWLVVVAVAFLLGYGLSAHDVENSLARIQTLQAERDRLREQLVAQRNAQTALERSHQIDVEAQRAAQEQIVRLEEERMRLEQQLKHLRALVGAGGKGVVEVDSLVLTRLHDDWYSYRLTLSQLVPDFGSSEGEVMLSLVVDSGEGRSPIPLAELESDSAGRHAMSFEHFQVLEGRFRLVEAVAPVDVIIEILPKDDTLVASKSVVGWAAALVEGPAVPTPQGPSPRGDGLGL